MNEMLIHIHDPLAADLGGPAEVVDFSITLFDVARFSGHLCPSVLGAFLAASTAVAHLFPQTGICQRGLVAVDMPYAASQGATGPVALVFGYVFGAWGESGFGGLGGGRHARRNLLRFSSELCRGAAWRFQRLDDGKTVHISYHPQRALNAEKQAALEKLSFKDAWQAKVAAIAQQAHLVLEVAVET
jgi:hypothetical protein